jgi:hypothetical protein
MLSDLLEATTGPRREASFNEVVLAVLLEALLIESILEVFEGESEVEDGYVDVCMHHQKSVSH